MGPRMLLVDLRTLPGCSADLTEPTAFVDIDISAGAVSGAGQADGFDPDRIAAGAAAVFDAEPFVSAGDGDTGAGWPEEFVLISAEHPPADDPWWVLARWVVALTVALQRAAGDPVEHGQVLDAGPRGLRLAIPWRRRAVIEWAVGSALALLEVWTRPVPDAAAVTLLAAQFAGDLGRWQDDGLGLETLRYARAAAQRDIPVTVLPGVVQLGWGANADRMRGSRNDRTDALAVFAADNTVTSRRLLAHSGVPLPDGDLTADPEQAEQVADRLGWPVALRPLKNTAGPPVPDISDPAALRRAFGDLKAVSPAAVVVEKRVEGVEHRLLVVEGRLLAATRRDPDGAVADVTAGVAPENAALAARAARLVGPNIADVEFWTADIGRPWRQAGGAVYEVRAQPDLRVHRTAHPGRDLYDEILDTLFDGRPARIPTTAVTGAGAGAAALLMYRIWAAAGVTAGVCTAEVLRIGEDVLPAGGRGGQAGGRIILTDPAAQAGVLQLGAEDVIRNGHPCDRYAVTALLSVDEPSAAQREILRRTRDAVVVAADPAAVALASTAPGLRRILVAPESVDPESVDPESVGPESVDPESVGTATHDGRAWIVHTDATGQTPLLPADEVPPGGLRAALFAAALAMAHGIAPAVIRRAMTGDDADGPD